MSIQLLRSEIRSFTRSERLFFFFVSLCAFIIMAEFSVTRPVSQSLFLTYFSFKTLPWIWLLLMPLNFLVIYLYNRFLPKVGPQHMFFATAALVTAINFACAFLALRYPWVMFFHFAWKDIYILLMLKQLWSMVHTTIAPTRAKYLYGPIYLMGNVGSVLGSLLPSFAAVSFGSNRLFLSTLPIYAILALFYFYAYRQSALPKEAFGQSLTVDPSPMEGFKLIRKNQLLIAVLLLIVSMQVSIALTEYQFNAHLEVNILDRDLRTAYCGKILGWANVLSSILQVVGGVFIIQVLGLKRSHLLIPVLLLSNAVIAIVFASFSLISFSYMLIKAIDFSLFGVLREMLYVPLRLDEKFRAKAVIDVFAHRSSKTIVSLFILGLQTLVSGYLFPLVSTLSIVVFLGWIGIVLIAFRKKHPAQVA